jgi:hypothetical protein
MMPHPERAAEPELGSIDGLIILQSLMRSVEEECLVPPASTPAPAMR